MIAAILQAHFRSLRFGRGVVLTAVARVIWYGLWTIAACGAGLWASVASAPDLGRTFSPFLMGIFVYWQLIPLLSASMGAALDLRKLLAYPIPHRKLFLVELLLRFTSGIEMVLLLTGGAAGMLSNPALRGSAAVRLLAALLIFIAFNVFLASGLRSLLERWLSRRHIRELVAFLMAMVGVVPRFFLQTGIRPKWLMPAIAAMQAVGLPWTAAAHAGFTHLASQSTTVAGISLAGWTLLAAWFGRRQFERSLRYDPQAAQATPVAAQSIGAQSLAERLFRLPALLWRDPLAGMVEKELRSLVRTPRFRMVFVMGFTFGLMLWLPMILGRGNHPTATRYFLTIVCVYSLTLLGGVTYWNCFGFDRSAAAFYFTAPLPIAQVLVAKNIVALIFIYLEVAMLSGILVVLRMGVGGAQIVETVVVMGICALYMLALGNVSSVHYPRALHPERVSQGGGGGLQGFLFLLYPLALIPVFLAYLARFAFSSQAAFALVLGLAAAIGAVLYKIGLDSAVSAAATRREHLLGELSKGGGPLVAG
jgi:ABC-2 type transport system permease protein